MDKKVLFWDSKACELYAYGRSSCLFFFASFLELFRQIFV